MKRTTIFVPEALERDLQLFARQHAKPVASVVREAVEEYLATRQPGGRLPSFAGVGESGRSDVSARHEDLLFADLDPHRGAPPPRRHPLGRARAGRRVRPPQLRNRRS